MTLPLRRLLRIAAAIAGLAVAAAAAAQPFGVSDLTRGWPLDGPIELRDFASGGEMAVFSAETGLGREPWVTDGTLEGTRPLADSCPGQCGSGAAALTGVDGHVFFVVRQETGDDWLFRTDGTVEGTVPLDQRLSNAEWLATANGRALFLLGRYHRDDDNHIRHWLVAYGTEAVEPSLEILLTGSGTRAIESGGRLWLTDSGLWVSDGTEAGTRKVDSRRACVAMTAVAGGVACWSVGALVFSDGGELETLADLGSSEIAVESSTDDGRGRAFYVARPFPGEGDELWVTDGTVAGTRRLDAPLELGEMGGSDGRVHFAGRDAAGFEPWTTDGTPGNSRRLADLCPGPCSSSPRSFVRFGRGVVFVADGANGEPGLWFAESPRHPPHRLSTGTPFDSGDLARAVEHRGDLYVDFDRRLLRVGSDLDVHQIDFVARGAFGIAGNAVVFGNGFGLWRADGAGVTSLSRPAASFAGDALPRLAPVAHRGGLCLELSGDVWCGDVGGFALRWEGHLANAVLLSAGEVLFAVDHNVVAFTDLGTETVFDGFVHLWKSALLDGDLYFFSASRPEGLWRSDGTAAGTRLVAGPLAQGDGLLVVGGRLIFSAAGPAHEGLWSSDGTFEGTVALPVERSTFNRFQASVFRGAAWFVHDGSLWSTDGTPSGTTRAMELDFVRAGDRWEVFAAGDRLFLVGGFDPEIWATDGSAPAVELTELGFFFDPDQVVASGHRLFFVADHRDFGRELWASDGTPGGTRVIDLFPGAFSSLPEGLVTVGEEVLFAAYDVAHGRELWISDGTLAGSRRLADVAPGPASSEPHGIVRLGDRLYFAADDGVSGTELWAMPWAQVVGGGSCQPSATRLCLGGGRFAVTVRWRDHINGGERSGQAVALPGSDATGTFWFFDPGNTELIVKALDGTSVNGHHWIFYGALSTVEYWIDVVDTATGETRRYHNPPGEQCGRGDTTAFAELASGSAAAAAPPSALAPRSAPAPAASCGTADALCLLGGSLAVEVDWHDPRSDDRGRGVPIPGSDNTGSFWFFDAANVELVVKALDGTAVNGHRWVFYGGLSDVEYEIRVTEVASGAVRTYRNPFREICGGADTTAF